jgi:hypothetical protein
MRRTRRFAEFFDVDFAIWQISYERIRGVSANYSHIFAEGGVLLK